MYIVLPTIMHHPTGIRQDAEGDGHFMAPRDGGSRLHRGVDLIGQPGGKIVSPISGTVDRIYRPYSSDLQWRGVFIKGDLLWVGMFYLTPYDNLLARKVQAGEEIGVMQDISRKYGEDMTPHVHLEAIIPPLDCVDRKGSAFAGEVFVNPMLFVRL